MSTPLSDATAEEVVRACRTQIGDELRSITYFTPEDAQHLYLREDLERGDKLGFVETERVGFDLQRTYNWSELGEYNFTLRDFENGYLVRIIADTNGVYLTTDSLTMSQFEEVTSAVKRMLDELD
jgi:hypothetical protein